MSSSGQNRTDIFHISVHMLLQHLTKSCLCARNYLSDIILFFSLINISFLPLLPLVPGSPAGPCGYVFSLTSPQHDVISVWLHELYEEKKKKEESVSKNRTKECKPTAIKSIRRRWKVCLLISVTSLGRLRGATGSLLQKLEVIPKGILSIWPPWLPLKTFKHLFGLHIWKEVMLLLA